MLSYNRVQIADMFFPTISFICNILKLGISADAKKSIKKKKRKKKEKEIGYHESAILGSSNHRTKLVHYGQFKVD